MENYQKKDLIKINYILDKFENEIQITDCKEILFNLLFLYTANRQFHNEDNDVTISIALQVLDEPSHSVCPSRLTMTKALLQKIKDEILGLK